MFKFARILTRAHLSLLLAVASLVLTSAAARGQSCLAGTAADEFTADRAGLTREWILQLPYVSSGWRLDQVVVGDGLVIAQTSDGTVHAVQAAPWGDGGPAVGSPRPGSLLWSQPVGSRDGVTTRAGIGSDLVAVAHERGITGLERSAQKKPLKKTAKKAKANWQLKESLLPIAIHDGGIDRIESAPLPLAAGVLWCTSDGLLVTLQPTEIDWRRLEFSLENPPAGSPVVRDRSIFATTTTGDLTRIDLPANLKELQLAWHAVLPGPAVSGPFLAGDTVVVSLGDRGIVAYSAETGTQLWHTCLTGKILAIGGGRVWVIDELGKLSAFDLADGSPRERLCLGPFTMPVVNIHSDRLLLASSSGMLVCLAPRGAGGTPTPAEAADASNTTSPATPVPGPSDPAATPRP